MPTTYEVGQRLIELCRAGENRKAIEELYADDAVSIEPMGMPGGPLEKETKGKDAILKSSDWFFENTEIHSASIDGPYPFEDRFICFMSLDCTAKAGPMAGQRMDMKEAAHYTVADGRITRAEFFWNAGC